MLCLPFFLLMILQAGNVWKWLIVPLCLFGAEIGYRIGFICCSERGRTQVTSLQLLPNQVRTYSSRTIQVPITQELITRSRLDRWLS